MKVEYGMQAIDVWREMVKEAGGHFIGVQQGLTEDAEPFVLFIRPDSSNPVSLPVSHMTEERVKAKLGIKTTPNVAKETQHFWNLIKMAREDMDHLRIVINILEEEIKKYAEK